MGAEPADAARARPLLEQLCRRIEHCGPVGAGATMKLAINLPLMISWQAFGEAFALCRDLGIEPARLLSLFTDISATTNALKARAPMVVAMMNGGDPGGVTFTVDSGAKDLRTMVAEGQGARDRAAAHRARARLLRGGQPQRLGARATPRRSPSTGRSAPRGDSDACALCCISCGKI